MCAELVNTACQVMFALGFMCGMLATMAVLSIAISIATKRT